MPLIRSSRGAALAAIALLIAAGAAIASDHQDTAEVELNPTLDMTDVYAFPGSAPGRIALVMMSRPFLTPAQTAGASFDENLLYQFKIDNTGDALEDRVIQVTFDGSGADQEVQVRGPLAPVVVGATGNRVADVDPSVAGRINDVLGSASGMQVFAGPRDDPFFIDLEAAFCILPDRKPEQGDLAGPCQLQNVPPFRPAGAAQNYVAGFNGLALVIEVPAAELTAGGNTKIGVWGTISR
jgi:hypothetical protein